MCGIFFTLYPDLEAILTDEAETLKRKNFDRLCGDLRKSNAERGPDYQSSVIQRLASQANHNAGNLAHVAEFYASELRLRGAETIKQPHQKDGHILCWNGEIFRGLEISAEENDGVKLMEELASVEELDGIIDVLGRVEGPYAFVYYHAASRRIYFGRDPLGRRSLLVHKPTPELPSLLISSVSCGGEASVQFEEVSTQYIHCLDMQLLESVQGSSQNLNFVQTFDKAISQLPRRRADAQSNAQYATLSRLNDALPPGDFERVEGLARIPDHLVKPVDDFLDALDNSTWLRVRDIPQNGTAGSARVSVLFSGGIDSTIIAYLAHKHISLDEPIDLLNVGFENPRKMRLHQAGNIGALPKRQQKRERATLETKVPQAEGSYRVPDRITGLQELEELRRLCPGRTWNFVEVNVPYEESQNARERVQNLMSPSRTVMDLSLAIALYFAARGQGQIRSNPDADPVPYTSPARVVLSGLGSDELLGGYGRHRSAFNTGGWPAVIEELQLEIDRIPTRNLGRDDRMISSHGKETRHPFLSLDVVSFLARLPIHHKLDPRAETGMGDKTLLRLLVRKVGLVEASSRKKRAMQFGSHSARMDGEKKGDVELGE